jgi:tetratricopeptide (TPR) repeat protein
LSFARALSRTGQTRRAGEEFENLTRAYPSNDQAWFEYGNFLSLVSEPEKARDAYETALGLNPDSAEVRNNLGALHVRERQYGNARVVLTDLNDRFPGYGPGWLNRAILEDEGSKDYPAALNALETYLRLGGRQTDVIERWQARLRAQTGGASYEGVPGG